MFQPGDKVLYGIQGVCMVVGTEQKQVDCSQRTYLVLEPLEPDGSRYMVPTHNAVAMGKLRPMLTREEMTGLLQSEAIRQGSWIADENQRKLLYRELIGSGDRNRLLAMVHTLYTHKKAQAAAGRKCHLCDENFLRDAEKLLSTEVAAVMELDAAAARQYIRTALQSTGELAGS